MPTRENCGKPVCILISLYLSTFTSICLAVPQRDSAAHFTFDENNGEICTEGTFRKHSFITDSSDTLDGLLSFSSPANVIKTLMNSQFGKFTGSLPDSPDQNPLRIALSEYRNTLKADCELMRSGRREYFPGSFNRQWSVFRFIVHSFLIEQTRIRATASLWMTDYLEAGASMWAEGIGRTTRVDLKVTIRRLPLFRQARLVSRYFQVSSPRSMWHEPWLERGYKFNVGDISLTDARFVSNLELQFPEILGGRGIVGALSLNADHGLGIGFNIDLPNYRIPGTRFKVKLPDISFVLFH